MVKLGTMFANHCVSVLSSSTAPVSLSWTATDELTESRTCSGPAAIVQSGGIHPVAAMPAKFLDTAGVAAVGSPGPTTGAEEAAIAATSSFFLVESLAMVASFFGSLALGARSLSA